MIKANLIKLIAEYKQEIKKLNEVGLYAIVAEKQKTLDYLNKELAKQICNK